jgi:hypothetical protein
MNLQRFLTDFREAQQSGSANPVVDGACDSAGAAAGGKRVAEPNYIFLRSMQEVSAQGGQKIPVCVSKHLTGRTRWNAGVEGPGKVQCKRAHTTIRYWENTLEALGGDVAHPA